MLSIRAYCSSITLGNQYELWMLIVLQSSIQDLDSAVSDTMDVSSEKCVHPANSDLPSAVESSDQTDYGKFVVLDAFTNFSEHSAVEFSRLLRTELDVQCTEY